MLGLGASDFEFGVDPSADPELALVSAGEVEGGCGCCAPAGQAQPPASPRLRRRCASPWRSRGSGKRRRPGGLRPLLRLRLGSQPRAGTVRSWAGSAAGRGGRARGRHGGAPGAAGLRVLRGRALLMTGPLWCWCRRERLCPGPFPGAAACARGRASPGQHPGWLLSAGCVCADSDDALLKMTITQQEFGRAGLPDLSSMTEEEQIAYAMQMSLQGAGECPLLALGPFRRESRGAAALPADRNRWPRPPSSGRVGA